MIKPLLFLPGPMQIPDVVREAGNRPLFNHRSTEMVDLMASLESRCKPLFGTVADVIFLAVPFQEHREVARNLASWQGKTIVDAMNGFGVSSAVVAKAFPGARLVKGFNHLLARTLASDPHVNGGRRVVFLSSDDEGAAAPVAALAEQLGFAPVNLGKFEEGGALVQARGDKSWGPLIFQDLFKQDA